MIRVVLPAHLRTIAHVNGEVALDVDGEITQRSVLDALEASYPMLRGTIRDQSTHRSVERSCGSSPARKTCPTSRRTPRSRDPGRQGNRAVPGRGSHGRRLT